MKRVFTGLLMLMLIVAEPCRIMAAAALVSDAVPIRNNFVSDTKEGRTGCNVFSIEIQGSTANVSLESVVDAVLFVAVYDEEGTEMITFGRTDVSARQKEAVVEIDEVEGQSIPKYFYVKGVLLEKETLRPLCKAYETPVYTKGMTQVQAPVLSDDTISCPLDEEGMSGNLNLEIHPCVKIYASDAYQYAEIRMDYRMNITGLNVSGAGEHVVRLPQMTAFPAGAELALTVSADSPAQLDAVCSGTIGYAVQNGIGIHNLTDVPFIKAFQDGEGSVSIGITADFADLVLQDTAGTLLSLKAAVGGKICAQSMRQEDSVSVRHSCETCLRGEVFSKADLEYRVHKRTVQTNDVYQNAYEIVTGSFYQSCDGSRSDLQPCPQHQYRTTFTVVDTNGSKVEGAQIQIAAMGTADTIVLTADQNGRASEYLPGGDYEIKISTPDGRTKTCAMTLRDEAKSMVITMGAASLSGVLPSEIITSSALKFKSIVLGDICSAAVARDGSMYTWGWNRFGQLGNGTTNEQPVPAKIALEHVKYADFGTECGCAVTEDGNVYTWGWNKYGQLGYDTADEYNPNPKKVELPGKVILACMGSMHAGAVLEDGSLYTWGNNEYGQLGYSTAKDSYNPVPKKVELLERVTELGFGCSHSGAVTEDASLYTWGSNGAAQLGRYTTSYSNVNPGKVNIPGGYKVLQLDFGYEHSGAVTEDGLYMWGSDFVNQGSLEAVAEPLKIDIPKSKSVLAHPGGLNSAVLTEDGFLYTWGFNFVGELGDGTTIDRFTPAKLKTLRNIVSASIGPETGGAVTQNGSVYIWGDNYFGELGNGSSGNLGEYSSEPLKLFSAGTDTAVFHDLTPNETYEFYMVKDQTKPDMLNADNLLYMTQGTADSSGTLNISYLTLNDYHHVEMFVKGADKKDLSAAQVTVSDLEYQGEIQYIQPEVTYNGTLLTEGKDYELCGDYCGRDIGSYQVFLRGIGDYKGMQAVSYKIVPGKKLVENITLSLADASVEAGSVLQLTAQVYPKEAYHPSLKWESDHPDIAVVDQNGLVTGIREGQVRITASSQDGSNITAGCVITVTVRPSDTNTGGSSGDSSGDSTDDSSGGSSGGSTDNSSGGSSGGSSSGVQISLMYYLVHFQSNGGNQLSRSEMTLLMDDKLGILPDVKRKGYVFTGWYTQKENGKRVEESTVLNASMTLYAHWNQVAKPEQVTKLSLKNQGDGQVMVRFQSVDQVQGYEILCSANKKFTAKASRKKLIHPDSDIEKTVVRLKKNKTGYVKVRAYRTDSAGSKIYGKYSVVKKIKV